MTTVDYAGNTFDHEEGWIRIQQSADKPKNKYSMATQAFPGYEATGNCFDDDGIKSIKYRVTTSPTFDSIWDGTINGNNAMMVPWTIVLNNTSTYYVYICPIDKNDYGPVIYSQSINISTSDDPILQIGAITTDGTTGNEKNGTYVGKIDIPVTAKGGGTKNITAIKYRIYTTVKDSGWITYTPTPATTIDYTIEDIDTSLYSSSTVRYVNFEAYCINDKEVTTGVYQESTHMTKTIIVDNDKPVIAISSPVSGSTQNATFRLSGSSSDAGSLIQKIYIGYFDKDTVPVMSKQSDLDDNTALTQLNKWHIITPNTTWSHDFDSNKITAGMISNYKLYVAAVDSLGNIGYNTVTININQDLDRPLGTVTNPAYTGNIDTPSLSQMTFVSPFFTMQGTAEDDDGVKSVKITLQQWNGSAFVNVTGWVDVDVTGTLNWTKKITSLTASETLYYKVIPKITDLQVNPAYPSGRTEEGTPSYFIVANKQPVVEILSPSSSDPDGDTYDGFTIYDPYGPIISNKKDDIYWDNITKNNDIYYTDSPKYKFGWEDGALFKESALDIFDKTDVDSTRSNYYRMIFKAKDSDSGHITSVEISYDGGSSWVAPFTNGDGATFTVSDPLKYAYKNNPYGDGYTYFFADIETQYLGGSSQSIKVKAIDNNTPLAYETIATVMVNIDNTVPTNSIVAWGSADPDGINKVLSVSNPYIGGNANDTDSAIRYVNLYFWNNKAAPGDTAVYNSTGTGTLTASVESGTHKVTIPDDLGSSTSDTSDVFDAPTDAQDTDDTPEYWVKAYMYTTANWKIEDIYNWNFEKNQEKYVGIKTKYGKNPTDGKKLLCIESIDNAGNKGYSFKEVTFGEFPPVIDKTNTLIKWKGKESTNGSEITSDTQNSSNISTPDTRIYISNTLDMTGINSDSKSGDPAPGINRVMVCLYTDDGDADLSDETLKTTWSVSGGTGSGTGNLNWSLSDKPLTSFDGNYYIVIEVRDVTGIITTAYQRVFIDNTVPTLAITKPEAGKKVAGDFRVYGTITDGTGGGFSGTTPVKVEVLNGGSVVKTDNVGITSSAWENWWLNTSSYTFDTVKVTVTDKSKNITVLTRSVTKDTQPPVYNTFTATGGSGAISQGSAFANSSFIDYYSKINSASEVFILNNNTSSQVLFSTNIYDADGFSDADVYITGDKQSDGNAISEITQVYTTAVHANTIGGTNTFTSLADGEYEYRSLVKQDSNAIEINLKKYFIIDNQKPHIWIQDMKNTDFVGYGTSTKYGHIDVGLNSNGSTTAYDDVSGVITVYVKAQDNYLLKNIQVKMTDYAFGTATAGAWTTILEKNSTTGVWGSGSSYGTLGQVNYYKCTKLGELTEANKDYVYLKLEFNTANVTNITGLAKILDFRVFDMAGNESVAADSSVSSEVVAAGEPIPTYSSPNGSYQKWARKFIDIVPYITNIARGTQTERTKYGKFIVLEGEEGLTISGYNLAAPSGKTNWIRLYNTTGASYDDISGTPNSTFTGFTAVSLSGVTHSGVVRIAVNSTEAINNVNTNTADNNVNKEDDGNGLSLSLWSDDRYLQVWSNPDSHYFTNSLNPMHPAMEGNGTTLYASWTNTSSARTYEASLTDAGVSSSTLIRSTYDAPEWTDIAINGTDWRVAFLENSYDGGTGWEGLKTRSSGGTSNIMIEKMGDDSASSPVYTDGMDEMMFQFQNPRVAINISDSNNYVSYYDLFSKCLKYGVTSSTAGVYTTASNSYLTTNSTTVVDGLDDYDSTPTSGEDVGLWSDIQMDGTIPVIVYYDTTNKRMKVARGTVTRPAGPSEWTKYNVTGSNSYVGYYVSMKIDSSHNLHIVSYKTATGDLVYFKGTWNSGSSTYTFGSEVVIDSTGNVGQWCDLELVGTDLYVSYINSPMVGTFYGAKYAYYDTTKSDWEYGVVALKNFVDNKRTSIVNTSNTTWKVAIGFASDYYRAAYLRSEE